MAMRKTCGYKKWNGKTVPPTLPPIPYDARKLSNEYWTHLGCAPNPKTKWQTFMYHYHHGRIMRFPILSVLVFSLKHIKDDLSDMPKPHTNKTPPDGEEWRVRDGNNTYIEIYDRETAELTKEKFAPNGVIEYWRKEELND